MARRDTRTRRSSVDELDFYESGFDPIQAAAQSELSRRKEAFDFSELDKKYPTANVRPITPLYMQREVDEYEMQRKAKEIELRKREAELNIYDSRLNQEREMYRQIPMARQALSALNPADDDFLDQLATVQATVPLGLENNEVQKFIVEPLLRRHEMLQKNKLEMESRNKPVEAQPMTPKDYQESIVRRNALLGTKTLEELQVEDPDTAFAVEELNRMIFQYQQQNAPRGGFGGMQQPATTGTPIPSGTPATQGGGFSALRSFIGE